MWKTRLTGHFYGQGRLVVAPSVEYLTLNEILSIFVK